jgi:uncharacterized protein YegL
MEERISKQKLNVILVVDTSKSMGGERIKQVNNAICDISKYLRTLQTDNVNVDFYLSVLCFGTYAYWHMDQKCVSVNDYKHVPITTRGQTNLHLAYKSLNEVLVKESAGGMMPDFGGVAPIILLLSDGHPSKGNISEEIESLRTKPWFKVALKYGIAIELDDNRTISILNEFVSNNGDVITSFKPEMLEKIIKIIVLTASKVKSQSSNISQTTSNNINSVVTIINQEIKEAINDIDDWEW